MLTMLHEITLFTPDVCLVIVGTSRNGTTDVLHVLGRESKGASPVGNP